LEPLTDDYINNSTPTTIDHAIHHLFGHIENRIEIGTDHRIPIGLRHLLKGCVAGDACVVD